MMTCGLLDLGLWTQRVMEGMGVRVGVGVGGHLAEETCSP